VAVLFISIGWMPFLAPALEDEDLLLALVITPCFYLHGFYHNTGFSGGGSRPSNWQSI